METSSILVSSVIERMSADKQTVEAIKTVIKRRRVLSLSQKQQVLKELDEGTSTRSKIMLKYNISPSSLSKLEKKRQLILSQKTSGQKYLNRNTSKQPATTKWMPQEYHGEKAVPSMWARENELASEDLGCTDFQASDQWCSNLRNEFAKYEESNAVNVGEVEVEMEMVREGELMRDVFDAFGTIGRALESSDNVPASVFQFLEMLKVFYIKDAIYRYNKQSQSSV